MARPGGFLPLLLLAGSPSSKYLEDFEFIQETVARRGAAVASKKIDWKAGAAGLRPRFEECASDVEHVKNAMRLLALLRDSHTGLVEFRLGVNDRPTPIRGVRTEGIGWPPDFLLPLGPTSCAAADPALAVGLDVLRLLRTGVDVEEARKAIASLSRGEVAAFRKSAARLGRGAKGFEPDRLADFLVEDLRATLAIETALLLHEDVALADALGAEARLAEIAPRARAAGLAPGGLEKAVLGAKAEAKAQAALLVS